MPRIYFGIWFWRAWTKDGLIADSGVCRADAMSEAEHIMRVSCGGPLADKIDHFELNKLDFDPLKDLYSIQGKVPA